ncbi:MAG: ispE [Ignavibacteria bacterium]|nr:ispE [Ignavibacteria bacterium]
MTKKINSDTLILHPKAKINLGLQILSKRKDGYHNINTVFSRISLHDELIITPAKLFSFECIPQVCESNELNLAFKAANAMKMHFGINEIYAKITLLKKIPSGAGLGGGSSDAASVLIGLNKFFNIKSNITKLMSIATGLGADVPYFIGKGTAVGEGKGEILDYFDYNIPYYTLIVFPKIKISTKWAYSSLTTEIISKPKTDFTNFIKASTENPVLLKEKLYNDFEIPVFNKYPEIQSIKQKMYQFGAIFALLSGSGSALYGFFENRERGEIALEFFKSKDGYFVELCEPIIGNNGNDDDVSDSQD